MGKRIITVIASLILAITVPFTAYAIEVNTLDGVIASVEGVISYKCKELNVNSTSEILDKLSENAGEFNVDWYYIALSQYKVNCKNEKSVKSLKTAVEKYYDKGLNNVKATDLQRVALALSACKADITDISGKNLLADATYNRAKYKPLDAQGVNSLSYALLLLDSKRYKIPDKAEDNRDTIIKAILDCELENGGFSLFGNGADIDLTSIVLQALAPYKNDSKVKNCVNRALEILSKRQDSSGAYKSFSSLPTAETTAQVILALTSLKINPINDTRFIKNGNTLLDGLNNFRLQSGAYCHITGYSENNIATYQSFCAMISVYRLLNGNKSFFDFTDDIESNTHSVNSKIKQSISKIKSTKSTVNKQKTVKEKQSSSKSYNSVSENKTSEINDVKNNKKTDKSSVSKKKPLVSKTETEETSDEKVLTIGGYDIHNPKDETENSSTSPLYINSIILICAYIVLFFLKSGGKR